MVTGDNLNTSCSVAKKTHLVRNDPNEIVLLGDGKLGLNRVPRNVSLDETVPFEFSNFNLTELKRLCNITKLSQNYDLVIDGRGFEGLCGLIGSSRDGSVKAGVVFRHFKVFARMSPSQKERLLRYFKELKIDVLMCGDGTNDVGALRQARVGIALAEETKNTKKSPENGQSVPKKSLLVEMFEEIV